MSTPTLSEHIVNRIDRVIESTPAAQAAIDAMYTVFGELERLQPDLHQRLDGAWIDVYTALSETAWADGWHCGREPGLLVFEPEAEPVPFEWLDVAPGVCIGLTADEVVGRILAGGAA